MSLIAATARAFEAAPIPDPVTRLAIRALVASGARTAAARSVDATRTFAERMGQHPIALATAAANRQHYEVPSEFFGLVLGPRRKYSCCYFDTGTETLALAEERALSATVDNAGLADGQSILELGCGWGSLTLHMAERFPAARIRAVSNSASQRVHIEARARSMGLANIDVVTADMNVFDQVERYDRIVSVEMFEHMSNWRGLLQRARGWLQPEGRMLVHVFSHISSPYAFNDGDKADWIAQHFFTGGIMPSHGLMRQFPDLFAVEAEWRWSGEHYRRTAEHWLVNFDANREEVAVVLRPAYGSDTARWMRRWRLFFLATAGLFGHADGRAWGVSHYRLKAT